MEKDTPLHNTSGTGASLADAFSADQVAVLEAHLDENYVSREAYEREREKRRAAERERDELRERVADMEARTETVEELEAYKTEHEKRHDGLSKIIEDRTDRIADLEDAVEHGPHGAVTGADTDPDPDDLPIEQMVDLPRAVAEDALTENDLRARWTWANWENLSERSSGGTVVTASAWMTAIRTAEDRPCIESKTRERVFKRLATYTGGAVKAKKQQGEWRLFRPDDWRDAARDGAAWTDAPAELRGDGAVSGVVG